MEARLDHHGYEPRDLLCFSMYITLPETQYCPPELVKLLRLALIACDICADFRNPIGSIMTGSEFGEPGSKIASVPEVAVTEHGDSCAAEDEIGPPRKICHGQAVAKA